MSPRDVAEELDELVLEGDSNAELNRELTCRGVMAGEAEASELEGAAAEVKGGRSLEEKLSVLVDNGTAFGSEDGIETGQNDHSPRPPSQKMSMSNLLKPTARRLDKQSPEASSSNLRCEKQAAVKDTPGAVRKLMGTFRPRSLSD